MSATFDNGVAVPTGTLATLVGLDADGKGAVQGVDGVLADRNVQFGRINFTRANLPKTANRLNRVAANATNEQSGAQFNGFRIDMLGDSLFRSPSDLYPSSGNQGGGAAARLAHRYGGGVAGGRVCREHGLYQWIGNLYKCWRLFV